MRRLTALAGSPTRVSSPPRLSPGAT
jgi:hypothetical protein